MAQKRAWIIAGGRYDASGLQKNALVHNDKFAFTEEL
jgi:hypothetical protein